MIHPKFKVRVPRRRPSYIVSEAFGSKYHPGWLMERVRGRCFESAKKMAQEFRDKIYKQEFPHAPLSSAYIKWKIRRGLDTRILIATKKYIHAIGVKQLPHGALIGFIHKNRIDIIKTKTGIRTRVLPYRLLARWLEYGTKTSPPRPHWRPIMKLWKEQARTLYRRVIVREVTHEIRKALKAAR